MNLGSTLFYCEKGFRRSGASLSTKFSNVRSVDMHFRNRNVFQSKTLSCYSSDFAAKFVTGDKGFKIEDVFSVSSDGGRS